MDPKELYLLQDGTQADPSDVSPDKAGVLRHKNGLAVCLTEDGKPQTIGMSTASNKIAADAGKEAAPKLPLAPTAKPAAEVKANEPRPAMPAPRDTKVG